MGRIFCAILFGIGLLYAGEEYLGRWSFIFYERAASYDGLMPPPIFNEIELRDDRTANVKVRAKDMSFDVPYLADDKFLGMKLPLKGKYEEPVRFKAEYAYSGKDGTLAIKGVDSSAVYVRTSTLLPLGKLVGTWQNQGNFGEQMEMFANGLMRLKKSELTGYCVLWKDSNGIETLTMVGGIKNAMPHTFIWQLEYKEGRVLVMTPVTDKGPKRNSASVWTRIK